VQMRSGRPGLPNWLYILIVASLGVYFIVGGIAWAIIAYEGRDVPDSFSTILATIAGGLVGLLTPAGAARSASRPEDEPPS
jgi:Na+/H+ antiporter NhaA